jgi:hypothetical protein
MAAAEDGHEVGAGATLSLAGEDARLPCHADEVAEIERRLMRDLGYENSHSHKAAFDQFANELHRMWSEDYRSLSLRVEAEKRAREEALAENARLARLVYVPGQWRCAKCKFTLIQANLNANDGTVTARDQPGEKCRNCDSPLWRVTERDAGNEMIDRAAEAFEAKRAAEARLAELARALEEAERFMAYFAGETDGVFVGPGTPKSCLQVIRRARATGL